MSKLANEIHINYAESDKLFLVDRWQLTVHSNFAYNTSELLSFGAYVKFSATTWWTLTSTEIRGIDLIWLNQKACSCTLKPDLSNLRLPQSWSYGR